MAAAAAERIPDYATYYPSLANCLPVKIFGNQLNASHDGGAYCHENRHFLDVALWKELKKDHPELNEVIAPHPPCKRLQGTRVDGGNVVIGMLKNPFKVTLLKARKDIEGRNIRKGQEVEIRLKNVLLVQDLPVPLHVSSKAEDWRFCNTGAFDTDFSIGNLDETNFPQRYRAHPYWANRDTFHIINNTTAEEHEELSGGLRKCMIEGDGKDARNELARKYGWSAIKVDHTGTESWEHNETGDRIDYFPMTDRAKTTVKVHPRDLQGHPRGNSRNKDLVRDNIGGNAGLARIFQNVRHHSGTGRYKKN